MSSTPLPRCPGGRRRGRSDPQYGARSVTNWMEFSPQDNSAYSFVLRVTTRKPRTSSNHFIDCSKSLTQISTRLVLVVAIEQPPSHSFATIRISSTQGFEHGD